MTFAQLQLSTNNKKTYLVVNRHQPAFSTGVFSLFPSFGEFLAQNFACVFGYPKRAPISVGFTTYFLISGSEGVEKGCFQLHIPARIT